MGGGVYHSSNNGENWNAVIKDYLRRMFDVLLLLIITYLPVQIHAEYMYQMIWTNWSTANTNDLTSDILAIIGIRSDAYVGTRGSGLSGAISQLVTSVNSHAEIKPVHSN